MLDLTNISLIAISCTRLLETQKAINICLKQCNFKNILLFTDDSEIITDPRIHTIHIDKLNSIKDYDYFVLKKLPYLINQIADHYLTIHWDGFIVNIDAWSEEFLKYDYIGAPWPWFNFICGNGGFCLKSQKFIETQIKLIDKLNTNQPDDVALCVIARKLFEEFGCIYAPPHIAFKFSTECERYTKFNSFGFHDFKYHPQFLELIK